MDNIPTQNRYQALQLDDDSTSEDDEHESSIKHITLSGSGDCLEKEITKYKVRQLSIYCT